MNAEDVAPWLIEVKIVVAEMLGERKGERRFRESVREWVRMMRAALNARRKFHSRRDQFVSKTPIQPGWVDEARCLFFGVSMVCKVPPEFADEREPPLPILLDGDLRNLSVAEKYTTLAAIHDWLTSEPKSRIDPWATERLKKDSLKPEMWYSWLLGMVSRDPPHENLKPIIQRIIRDVREDLDGRTSNVRRKGSRPPHRPPDTDANADATIAQIWEAWRAKGNPRSIRVFAKDSGYDEAVARAALDRHRKRPVKQI